MTRAFQRGERDVSIGPDEIERAVLDASTAAYPGATRECVEWQLELGTGLGQIAPRLSLYVNLSPPRTSPVDPSLNGLLR